MSNELNVALTEEELLLRFGNTEDNFVERKSISDWKDWLKTVVAFANSCPIGFPGLLFIGVNDDGTVQRLNEPVGLEKLQKSLAEKINEAWPPIYFLPKILRKEDREFLVVLVPGSPQRPHFAGQSYVRVGPETRRVSEDQFDNLILQRSSKGRELVKMIGKQIAWEMFGRQGGGAQAVVADCNQFFITLDGGSYKRCFPIDWITISFDPTNQRPHLMVHYP